LNAWHWEGRLDLGYRSKLQLIAGSLFPGPPGSPQRLSALEKFLPQRYVSEIVVQREPTFSWRSKMTTIKVEGMVCQVCANSITRTLGAVKGVKNPVVDLEKGEVNFEEDGPIDPNDLKTAVERAGYRLG
jgi:copper chaperone CopZ